MYVVLITNKSREPFSDIIPELKKVFPLEVFSIYGSEEKGYQLRIEGTGDARRLRFVADQFRRLVDEVVLLDDRLSFRRERKIQQPACQRIARLAGGIEILIEAAR